jgi:hypothetical protein
MKSEKIEREREGGRERGREIDRETEFSAITAPLTPAYPTYAM